MAEQELSRHNINPSELWGDAWKAIWRISQDSPVLDIRRRDESWMVYAGSEVSDYNMIVVDGGINSEEALIEYREFINRERARAIFFLTDQGSLVEELAKKARILELKELGKTPLMVYNITPESQFNVSARVQRVDTLEQLAQANAVQSLAFSFPIEEVNRILGIRALRDDAVNIFLLSDQGEPISSIASVVHPDKNAVSIWNMGTNPRYQKKGYGEELFNSVLAYYARGRDLTIFLLATEAGEPLYTKIGFQTISYASVWENKID